MKLLAVGAVLISTAVMIYSQVRPSETSTRIVGDALGSLAVRAVL